MDISKIKIESSYLYIVSIILLFLIIYHSYTNGFRIPSFTTKKDDSMKTDSNGLIEILDKENHQPKDYIDMVNNIAYQGNGPILTKENQTQYDFKKLLKNVEHINQRKRIKLKGLTNYQSYTQTTTQDRLRMDLDQITKRIISILNSENTYDFAKTNYGDVKVWTDKENNEEIKYELFLWDKKHFFEIKFLIHVVKFVDTKYAGHYGVKKSPYLFPTYFIGYPCKDQLIPTPDQVITSGNVSNYPEGICTNDPLPIQYLYINDVEIWNSTLIVNYTKNMYPYPVLKVSEKPNGMGGITDSKLEYIGVKGDKNPIYPIAKDYNQWIRLDSEPSWEGQYPCKEPPFNKWNDEGIYYYEKGQGAIPEGKCKLTCAGTRWSSMGEPLQPNFWVSNFQVQPCGENFWLFDNARGLPGVFFGGGKK